MTFLDVSDSYDVQDVNNGVSDIQMLMTNRFIDDDHDNWLCLFKTCCQLQAHVLKFTRANSRLKNLLSISLYIYITILRNGCVNVGCCFTFS